MKQKIVIVDYGLGNLHSVYKKLLQLKADVAISNSPKEIAAADKIVLPGIGHFQKGMDHLESLQLIDPLNEAVLVSKKPVLGICLGMQLMGKRSEEAPGQKGLGWLEADTVRFRVADTIHFKVPHTGWNGIHARRHHTLLEGIAADAEFYFTHSYHLHVADPSLILTETNYEYSFVSAVNREHIFGVQFHPEKSHDAGMQLFRNFLNL
jgi:glutamine amidotransferase